MDQNSIKPIFVITLPVQMPEEGRRKATEALTGYHVIFMSGDTKCQLFSTKETIELTDLKQLQDYLDEHKY